MKLAPETPVHISLGTAFLVIVAFLGVVYWVTDQMKGEVSELRTVVREDDQKREDGNAQLRQNIVDLTARVADLTAKLDTTNTNLAAVATSSSSLADSIRGVDQKLTSSIDRQKSFETYVVARLGASYTGAFDFPTSWTKSTFDVISLIKSGDNPLIHWSGKALPEQKN